MFEERDDIIIYRMMDIFLLLDTSLPIIPGKQIAGINLGDDIGKFGENINSLLKTGNLDLFAENTTQKIYDIKNTLRIYFDFQTGKVTKIVAQKLYKGTLFEKIRVGDFLKSIVDAGYSLIFDDFDYVFYIKDVLGICIEVEDSELNYFRDAISLKIKYIIVSEPNPYYDELFFRDMVQI